MEKFERKIFIFLQICIIIVLILEVSGLILDYLYPPTAQNIPYIIIHIITNWEIYIMDNVPKIFNISFGLLIFYIITVAIINRAKILKLKK